MSVELEDAKTKVAQFQKQCEEYLVVIVQQKREADEQQKVELTLIMFFCLLKIVKCWLMLSSFLCHLKLELQTQFPASNDEKYVYFFKYFLSWIIWKTEHLPQTILYISLTYYLV